MSQEEVDTIRTGLEYLLQSPDNWNRTFGLVFWYDDPDAENLIEKVLNAENDEDYQLLMAEIEDHNVTLQSKDQMYQSGLNALMDGSGVRTGRIHACYHMMGVRFPAQGRFYLTNYTKDTYAHLKENIKRWYRDTALLNPYTGNDSSIVNLWSALFGLLDHPDAKDKQKEFQVEYGMDSDQFLKAVLSGGPLSFHMLMKASAHIEKEILDKKRKTGRFRDAYIYRLLKYILSEKETRRWDVSIILDRIRSLMNVGVYWLVWMPCRMRRCISPAESAERWRKIL